MRLSLALLALAGCPAPAPPAAPPPAKQAASACPDEVFVCGTPLDVAATEASCVGAGPADLGGLRCAAKVSALTMDDHTLAALDEVDDATLARIERLVVKPVTRDHETVFQTLQWSTPTVKGDVLGRLSGLRELELEVRLDDPSVLRGLTGLRTLKLPRPIADPTVFASMTHLSEISVHEMEDLAPLLALRELRTARGLGSQPGACELLGRNRKLRLVHLDAALLGCNALVTLPRLRTVIVSGEGGDLSALAHVDTLRELDLTFQGRWTGLEALPQLESLSLWLPNERALADAVVRSLAPLKNLRRLKLMGGKATLEPLAGLPRLVELEGPTGLDIEEVAPLRHLERLTWHGSGDSRHLAELVHLRHLEWTFSPDWRDKPPLPALEVLRTHAFGDVATLRQSPALRELDLGGVSGNLSALGELTELRSLSLRTDAPSLAALGTLQHLERLDLDGYEGELSWVGRLPALSELILRGRAPDVASLPASLELDRLALRGPMQPTLPIPALGVRHLVVASRRSGPSGSDLAPLHLRNLTFAPRLRGLTSIEIRETNVRSLEPLRGLQRLRRVVVDRSPITSLEPLRGLPLREVTASGTRIHDLSPLDACTTLDLLDVSDTSVDDFRPIGHHPHLRFLLARETPLGRVGQLADLPSLYFVDISGTGVRDIAPLAATSSLRYLVPPRTVTDFTALADLPLAGVSTDRFDCASEAVVPILSMAMIRVRCIPAAAVRELSADDVWGNRGDDDDPFDKPWRGP